MRSRLIKTSLLRHSSLKNQKRQKEYNIWHMVMHFIVKCILNNQHFLTLLGGLVVELISTLVWCDTALCRTGVRGLSKVLRTSCSLAGEDGPLTRGSEFAPAPAGCRGTASVTRPKALLSTVSFGQLGDRPESLVLGDLNSWLACLLEKWRDKHIQAEF